MSETTKKLNKYKVYLMSGQELIIEATKIVAMKDGRLYFYNSENLEIKKYRIYVHGVAAIETLDEPKTHSGEVNLGAILGQGVARRGSAASDLE